ncbi:MAG TPA: PilT/PilU family type 4a pilus ATPase [Candidatus Lustribacter sp.]|nr:PilT/PilU family type 4a pilus ATPase [Candidatus Lustribacter sp.]
MSVELLRLTELIALARGRGASDLHAGAGNPPTVRINGRAIALDVPPLGAPTLESFLESVLPAPAVQAWTQSRSVDVARRAGIGAPYRLHAYATMSGPRLAFRFLQTEIPALDRLALPPVIGDLVTRPTGLIIFTGPTGSGKTTALAAAIDRINRTAERVIVTVEDPVEYVHGPIRSVVAHCEIGTDVDDYAAAIHGFMRSDPDVILVGEMRDRTTMEAVLSAAETGHLVLSTLHTADAAQTIDRIIDAFSSDGQSQVRTQLSATLLAVIALRLVPLRNGAGRIAVSEVLIGTDAVRAMIREGKTHQLRNAITTGRASGMRTLETSLSDLVVRGSISLEAARLVAARPAEVRDLAPAPAT